MEEIDNKLLSKDQTVLSSTISKVVEKILENEKEGDLHSSQLSFLQNKVFSSDDKISEICAEGILKLVKDGILDSNKLLEEIVTLIPNNKIGRGVVKTICGILYYQFSKNNDFQRKFNLFFPQHPFVTVLISNPESLPYICKEIKFASNDPLWNFWNFAFHQYCFCNPVDKKPMYYKIKLWTNLLLSNGNEELIIGLLNWLPFDPSGSLLVSAELLNELSFISNSSKIDTEIILILQVSVLIKLISKNHDPRDTISAIRSLMNQVEKIDCINPILLILVQAITRASATYALEILEICEQIIEKEHLNYFVLQSLKAAILHWIGNPSTLSSDVCTKASVIYIKIEDNIKRKHFSKSKNEETFKKYQDTILANEELFIAFELTKVCDLWKNKESLLEFLRKVENSGYQLIKRVIHLVFGIFISDLNDVDITLAAFKVICAYLKNFDKFSHLVLTLILYNLSNTSNSQIHFELLRYLPKLSCVSENYLKIVTTIKVLQSSSDDVLKTFGMRLMCDLWTIDKNVYPLLEEMLTQEEPRQQRWEFFINKTQIIKEICETNSKLYGEDMVAHLSRILNKCSEEGGELASSIAIDAISILCSEGIIDIKTTWLTLAPKYFDKNTRTKTVKSMCGLASAISNLMHPEHHKELQKEVLSSIWEYAINSADIEVKIAAFDALATYGLENISPYFPNQYLNEETAVKPDMQPQLVPGSCWMNFMKDQTNLTVVGDFLIKLIKKEVDEYPKFVYHITSKREPTDYSLLPAHSLVRGVVQYCTTQMNKWNGFHKHVYIECMRILSQEYSKPLPPYNWSFLQQFLDEPELKIYCLTIAAHQVMISGTARKIIEQYIEAMTADYENLEGVLFIYRNLRFLANSIQPHTFELFFNSTLNYAQHLKSERKNEEFIVSLIECIKDMLANLSVQEVSKRGIVSYIDATLTSLNESDEVFELFLSCISCYPRDLTKNITATDQIGTEAAYRKAVSIRCELAAKRKEKLYWLGDLIDRDRINTKSNYPLEEFLKIFKQQENLNECIEWTLDLIGRIEVAIADNRVQTYVIFLIEVLVIAIVAFSGFHIFASTNFKMEQYLNMFPQAANVLLGMNEWSNDSSKIIECFYFFNSKKECVPDTFKNMFGKTLQSLRQHMEFKKGNKWMKYLNADVDIRKIK